MYVNESVKNTERIFPEQGRTAYHRYDMNENPDGLPAAFVASVVKRITPVFLATYPEPDRFLRKYADSVGVSFEQVVATNGSDQALRYIFEVFGEQGKDVLTVSPTFGMYGVNCAILGLNHKQIPYADDFSLPVASILAAITSDTRIVALVNPNNPVGDVYAQRDIEKIIDKAASIGAIVLIDEAYHFFYEETAIPLVKTHTNVIVTRTFSKLYSLAAVRLGVIISSPKIIHYLKNAKLTFDVNAVALLFGEAILDTPELTQQLIAAEREGKAYAVSALKAQGYEVISCKANFILVKPKHPVSHVAERLKAEKHILVHTFGSGLLKDYLRISTGAIDAMRLCIDAFLEIDGGTL